MPQNIPNTTVTSDYKDATFSFGDVFASGFITVANNPVVMQMAIGPLGQASWGPEYYISPSTFPLQGGTKNPIAGIRFKQFNSALTPAPQVFGALFYAGEPAILAGTPFTQIVSPAGAVGTGVGVIFRKLTSKDVSGTVTDTDLLNGEFTVAGGTMAANSLLRIACWGDWRQNSGATDNIPRFAVKLGPTPTTVLQSNTLESSIVANSAARYGWHFVIEILNLNALSSQEVSLRGHLTFLGFVAGSAGTVGADFTTGRGSTVGWFRTTSLGQAAIFEGINEAAINTAADMAVIFSVINPNANANTSTRLLGAVAEVL